MPATARLDSRALADGFLDWVREEAARLPAPPCLAAVTYEPGADEASRQYRDLILKDARRAGCRGRAVPAERWEELQGEVRALNADPEVSGIVVMYPLRGQAPDTEVMDQVSPAKDIEGLHSLNLGYLIKFRRFLDEERGVKCVVPATAKAVVKTLQSRAEIRIDGAFVAIVNNSMRVGKPLGLMLENLGATVVKCYDRTARRELEACVRMADILVTAVPDPAFRLEPSWVKPGAVVIDVSHQGNVEASALEGRAALVSGADNRIGRMTRAMMLVNLVYCSQRQAKLGPAGAAGGR